MWYFIAFIAAVVVDSIPVFAPPVWTILVIIIANTAVNPWLLLIVGVAGSCMGRLFLMAYIPKVGKKTLSEKEYANLNFLGEQLSKSPVKSFIFVFIYTLTPLSTTALFTAAGLANCKKKSLIIPFAVGKLISDGVMIYTGNYAVENFRDLLATMTSVKGICLSLFGIVIILMFIFIDWRSLLENKKLKFQFNILK